MITRGMRGTFWRITMIRLLWRQIMQQKLSWKLLSQ